MYKLKYLVSIIIFFSSCSNVSFVNSQPENIDALVNIPQKYHGTYVFEDSTLFINSTRSYLVTDSSIGDMVLGKNLILKKKGNFFYINYYEENKYNKYGVYVLKINKALNYERIEILFPNITEKNIDLFNILNLEEVLEKKEFNGYSDDIDYLLDGVSDYQMRLLLQDSMADDPVILKRIR